MRKVTVFNFITLNGFFKGPNEDISWHKHGDEESAFAAEGSKSGSALLFGRVTFQMMEGYWPTPMAKQSSPEVAEGMNASEKIVFSKTLKSTNWKNSRIVRDNPIDEVKRLKKEKGNDLTVLGSGSIVTQLAENNLIDTYMLMVDPVVLGEGTPIFHGIKRQPDLKLIDTRKFKSGVVLLTYQPK
jgi:dihydrofolate reductase